MHILLFKKRIFPLLLTLFLVLPLLSLEAADSISVPGFGKIRYSRKGSTVSLPLGKLGAFTFAGTVKPLKLKTIVGIKKLRNFPGYKVLSRLGLRKATLTISRNGLSLQARADTKGNLKTLCKFLKIKAPYVDVSARIARSGIALRGALSAARKPLALTLNKKLGTRIKMKQVGLGFSIGRVPRSRAARHKKGDGPKPRQKTRRSRGRMRPVINVFAEYRIQPTKYDPELPLKLTMSYNLVSQEIAASGSLIGKWSNPMGLDRVLEKDALVLEDAAVSIGWIPGAPSPTRLGFYIGRAKLFKLDVGFAADLSPSSGQIALQASCQKLSMNDLLDLVEKGFKVELSDNIPGDIAIKDFHLLFAPNGGQVGEFSIEEGLALKGKLELTRYYRADLDFSADFDHGIRFYMAMDASRLYDLLEKRLRRSKGISPVLNQTLSSLQIRKFAFFMTGKRSQLGGGTKCELEVLDRPVSLQVKGYVNPEGIVKKAIGKIKGFAKNHIKKMYRKVGRFAHRTGSKGIRLAKRAGRTVKRLAKKIGTTARHLHRPSKCYKTCIPNYAKPLRKKLYRESNKAVKEYYNDMLIQARQIDGGSRSKTRALRNRLFRSSWHRLCRQLDKEWRGLVYDGKVISFFIRKSKAEKGNRIYKKLIRAYRDRHRRYRKRLYRKLLRVQPFPASIPAPGGPPLTRARFHLRVPGTDQYMDLGGSARRANRNGAQVQIWHLRGREKKAADRRVRFIPHVYADNAYIVQFQNGGRVLDIRGNRNRRGKKIQAWKRKARRRSQIWRLVPHRSQRGRYFLVTATSGRKKRCLDIKGGNKNIYKRGTDYILWDWHKRRNQQLELVYANGPHKGRIYVGSANHNKGISRKPAFFAGNKQHAFEVRLAGTGGRYKGSAYTVFVKRRRIGLIYDVAAVNPRDGAPVRYQGLMRIFYGRLYGGYRMSGKRNHPLMPYIKKKFFTGLARKGDRALTLKRGRQVIRIKATEKSRASVIPPEPEFFVQNRNKTFKYIFSTMSGGFRGTARVLSIKDNKIVMRVRYKIRDKVYNRKKTIYYSDGRYTNNNKNYPMHGYAAADSKRLSMSGGQSADTYIVPE